MRFPFLRLTGVLFCLAGAVGCGGKPAAEQPAATPAETPKTVEYQNGFWGPESFTDAKGTVHNFRWTKEQATAMLPPWPDEVQLRFGLRIPLEVLSSSPKIVIALNGTTLESFIPVVDFYNKSYRLPAGTLKADAPNLLTFKTSATMVPAKVGSGTDNRTLGLQIVDLRLERPPKPS